MFKKIILGVAVLLALAALIFYIWPQPKYKPTTPSQTFLDNAKSYHIPPMPPDWSFKDFTAKDGRRLRWGETGNRGAAKATLVFVPGFGGMMEMYGEQVDILAERGYHVVGFEARGMGGGERDNPKQPEQMNPSDFKTYSDDFAKFYQDNISSLSHDKAILALSFGAHLSMRATAEHDLDVQAYIASAPALRLKTGSDMTYEEAVKSMQLLKRLGRGEYYLPGFGHWKPYSDDLTQAKDCGSNPERLFRRDVILASRPELRTGDPTINWVLALLKSGTEYINSDAFKTGFDVPARFMLADTDMIIANDFAKKICDDIASCETEILADARHCLWTERDEILFRIFDSVDEVLNR